MSCHVMIDAHVSICQPKRFAAIQPAAKKAMPMATCVVSIASADTGRGQPLHWQLSPHWQFGPHVQLGELHGPAPTPQVPGQPLH